MKRPTKKLAWTVERLSVSAAFGALATVIAFTIAVPLSIATGLPAGGVIGTTTFVMPMIYSLFALILPLFPSCTLIAFIQGVLMLFTPALGPPGFLPKVVINVGYGFIYDLLFFSLRKHGLMASMLSGLIAFAAILLHMNFWFSLVLPPSIAKNFADILVTALILTIPLSPIGGLTGWIAFSRIEGRNLIRRLRT